MTKLMANEKAKIEKPLEVAINLSSYVGGGAFFIGILSGLFIFSMDLPIYEMQRAITSVMFMVMVVWVVLLIVLIVCFIIYSIKYVKIKIKNKNEKNQNEN